ncbi:BTAD domain-containing putative transcriptional regulator [Streptomyces cavourensis]
MRYCILGTTRALRDDGTAVPLGGARLRALLTVLALHPGRTVPVGVLVDEVWDGDPPADAPGALQALVGRLRRALGRSAVESAEGGYRLAAGADAVDLHRFERLAGEGSRALEQGDAGKALTLLDEALALWAGPPLADLPDRAARAHRPESRRLGARRARLEAMRLLGRADEALWELSALCAAHPLDEPLQALRIRALRDAGRTAEALAAYEEVRTVLSERLGTDPGPELRGLYGELLHQEPGPAPAPYGGPRHEAPGPGPASAASAPSAASGSTRGQEPGPATAPGPAATIDTPPAPASDTPPAPASGTPVAATTPASPPTPPPTPALPPPPPPARQPPRPAHQLRRAGPRHGRPARGPHPYPARHPARPRRGGQDAAVPGDGGDRRGGVARRGLAGGAGPRGRPGRRARGRTRRARRPGDRAPGRGRRGVAGPVRAQHRRPSRTAHRVLLPAPDAPPVGQLRTRRRGGRRPHRPPPRPLPAAHRPRDQS